MNLSFTSYWIFYLLLLILNPETCYLQEKRDYNWQLGNRSNVGFNAGIQMLFSSEGIIIDTFYRAIGFEYFNASISDSDGNLILYSNGCEIRDGNHQLISGTKHLSPGDTDIEWCHYGYPVADGGLFIPFFGDSVVMLLHQREEIVWPPVQIVNDSLFYTTVSKQGNQYKLLDKTIPIVGGILTDGNVKAVKSTTPGAWWVIQGERYSNKYFKILIDSAKISAISIQTLGDTTKDGSAAGQAVISPDGSMYARYSPKDDLFLFDFDRTTGLLSGYRRIPVADSGFYGGIAFSPNSRFLYLSTQFDLYQFDTWATDVSSSQVHIDHYDGHVDPFPTTFYHMQLAPDCRIYMNSKNGSYSWHVIHTPDQKGLQCGFEQHAITFPVSTSITMPNFPNYRLDVADVCDPGLINQTIQTNETIKYYAIYPNPTSGPLYLKMPDAYHEISVEIRSINGEIILQKYLEYMDDHYLNLVDLSAGVYFIIIKGDQLLLINKVIKI